MSHQTYRNMYTSRETWAEGLESYCSTDSFSAFYKGLPRKPKITERSIVNIAFGNIERYIAKATEIFKRISTTDIADMKDPYSADNGYNDRQHRGWIPAKPRYIERVYREHLFCTRAMSQMQNFHAEHELLNATAIWPESPGSTTRKAANPSLYLMTANIGALGAPIADKRQSLFINQRANRELCMAITRISKIGSQQERSRK